MERSEVKFRARDQVLTFTGGIRKYASDTVNYVEASFELQDNWSGFDVIAAVWNNGATRIVTDLDSDGKCRVPQEVLSKRGDVFLNLTGTTSANGAVTERLTTYPVWVLVVEAKSHIKGAETAEITPSQFEQFASIVHSDADRAYASRTEAAESASSASQSATEAAQSSSASVRSANEARQMARDALTYANQARDAEENASASAQSASTSEQNASASASAAATSAESASDASESAGQSAEQASASAQTASSAATRAEEARDTILAMDIVEDVTIEGTSIVDANNVAKIPNFRGNGAYNSLTGLVPAFEGSSAKQPNHYYLSGSGSWRKLSFGVNSDSTKTTITFNSIGTQIPAATSIKAGVMTAADRVKLDSIEAGAEVNVQSDWDQTDDTADDFIKNKPSVPTYTAGTGIDITNGVISIDLDNAEGSNY